MADVVITDVMITPNPVTAGAQYIISVEVLPKVFAIMDTDNNCILDADGCAIERATETDSWYLLDSDGNMVQDDAGNNLEIVN